MKSGFTSAILTIQLPLISSLKPNAMKNAILLSFVTLLFAVLVGCEKDGLITTTQDDQIGALTLKSNAGNAVKPFKGMYKGFSIDAADCAVQDGVTPVHFFFNGNATHVGKSTWDACQYNIVTGVDPETGYLLFEILESYFTITAADGDIFTGIYDGEGELREDGNVYFWGTFYVTPEGNTGRFECVTGELPYDGQTHPDGNFFYIEDGYLDFTNDDG